MRFDYFENFWNEYQDFFEDIKINKEILKQVYHYNAESLIPTKKPLLMDAFSGQEYEMINNKENKTLVIKPVGAKQESYKMISIAEDFIKIFNMNSNSISIEKFDYQNGNINLKLYDEKALSYLAENDYLITFEPDKVDGQMKKIHLEPDVEFSVITKKYGATCRIEKNGEPYYLEPELLASDGLFAEKEELYTKYKQKTKELKLEELLNSKTK